MNKFFSDIMLNMKSQGILKSVNKLPTTSGVYFFRDSKNRILYIGKATSLKSRVRSYFTKDIGEKRSPLIAKMIEEAKNVSFQKTDSVLEALLLESNLIKKYQPPYNSADKDQKSFNYVVITKEAFPRVLLVRERVLHDSNFIIQASFGPFPHGNELREALKIIRKIFPFRDKCGLAETAKYSIDIKDFSKQQPRERLSDRDWRESEGIFQQKNTPVDRGIVAEKNLSQLKPCFNYQIGLCPGTCVGAISQKEYAKTIKHIETFFSGNTKKLIKNLETEMKTLAKKRDFEKAEQIKKKIFAIKHIQDVSLIKTDLKLKIENSEFRIEAYDIAHLSGTNMVGVITVVENGEANKNEYRLFNIKGQKEADPTSLKLRWASDTEALAEVLERRLNHPEWRLPNLFVADGGVAQLNTVETILKKYKIDIPVVAVTKDERHKAKEVRSMNNEARIMGEKYEKQILLANSEAHRFAITHHRKRRNKLPR